MQKPNSFIRLTAWWYRNIKYRDRVVEFRADRQDFELFELVNLYNGIEAYYLGAHKFLPKNDREQFFNANVYTSNIPQIAP